jgi:hypothetical protein
MENNMVKCCDKCDFPLIKGEIKICIVCAENFKVESKNVS